MTDKLRDFALLPVATRAAGTYNVDFDMPEGARGLVLTQDVTADSGTPTLDTKLQTLDPISGAATDISGAAFTQVTGSPDTQVVSVHPEQAADASAVLPRRLRLVSVVGGTTPDFTYSVGASPVP